MKNLVLCFLMSSSAHALIGGKPSTRGLFPSNVNTRAASMDCGGIAVSRNQILTAAHCVVSDDGTPLYVPGHVLEFRHGEDKGFSPSFLLASQPIKSVVLHPSYAAALANTKNRIQASRTFEAYDLAIITFQNDLRVPIAEVGVAQKGPVILTGGGCVVPNGDTSNLLKYGTISFTEVMDTVGVGENTLPEKVSVCAGDSGSPAYQNGKAIGILRAGSAFKSDGQADYAVFTLIDIGWVTSQKN
jgi:hypothetical protein